MLEIKHEPDSGMHVYVHYKDFNRRLDGWVSVQHTKPDQLSFPSPESAAGASAKLQRGRRTRPPAAANKRRQRKQAAQRSKRTGKKTLSKMGTGALDGEAMDTVTDGAPESAVDGELADDDGAGDGDDELGETDVAESAQETEPSTLPDTQLGPGAKFSPPKRGGKTPGGSPGGVGHGARTAKSTGTGPDGDGDGDMGGKAAPDGTGADAGAAPSRRIVSLSHDHSNHHRVRNVDVIHFGRFAMETWYFSPYPPEYTASRKLWICQFCLAYLTSPFHLARHMEKCKLCELRHPPGTEIYRKDNVSFFELDGSKSRMYCQNLCLISKIFLDHKTVHFDVDPFLFYLLCEYDEHGFHLVGYFSKEKYSSEGYNVACIMTFPCYQRKGYGNVMIAFSYELSKREKVPGSPEKPLSDLGLLSYRSYWTKVLLHLLWNRPPGESVSIETLSRETSITCEDIQQTLTLLKVVEYVRSRPVIVLTQSLIDKHLKKNGEWRLAPQIDSAALHWTKFVHTRARAHRQ